MTHGSHRPPWRLRLLIGLTGLLAYVVLVSRAEFLPTWPGRELLGPLLLLLLALVVGWQWRAPLRQAALTALAGGWWLWLPLLLLATGVRLLLAWPARPASPAELAVLQSALQIINNGPVNAPDIATLLLGWLHAPVAAARFMAGVSAGQWQTIPALRPEELLPWSRLAHLALSLATVVIVASAVRRRVNARAGWLAGGLLAVAGPSATAALTIDPIAPLALLVTIVMLRAPATPVWHLQPEPTSRSTTLAQLAGELLLLWLPGIFAIVAPLAALYGGPSLAALWSGPGRASSPQPDEGHN